MMADVESGVSSAGLAMIEQPVASAAAIFLDISDTGKFQGEKAMRLDR